MPMIRALTLILAVSTLTACHLDYVVELKPDGDRLIRGTKVDAGIEPSEIAALEDAYGQPESAPPRSRGNDGKQTEPAHLVFHGIDSGTGWPDGFGGKGSWATYDSPLGSADCFLECLGGDVNALADMLALQDGIDAVVSRIKTHLRKGLRGNRMLPRILRLIDDRLTPDARDAAVLGWALLFSYKALPEHDVTGDGPGRERLSNFIELRIQEAAVAFLWQRGWITASEALRLTSPTLDISDLSNRIIARSLDMDLNSDWMTQLDELEDEVSACFPKDFNDQLKADFANAVDGHPRLAVAWAATSSILTNREVTVGLKAAEKPSITNGDWNSERQSVVWTLDTAPLAIGLTAPPLCWSASWAHPDEAAQNRLLGHVGVDGESLVTLCLMWSEGTDKQRSDALDIIDSFANARRGTDIRVDTAALLGECKAALRKDGP
jgi:hypothetical protein